MVVITTQFQPMKAYGLIARLGKVAGPALAELGGVDLANGLQSDMASIGPAVSKLLAGVAEDIPLALELLKNSAVIVDGKDIALLDSAKVNKAFAGNLPAMFATLKFVLEVNFADFFAEGLNVLKNEEAPKKDPE